MSDDLFLYLLFITADQAVINIDDNEGDFPLLMAVVDAVIGGTTSEAKFEDKLIEFLVPDPGGLLESFIEVQTKQKKKDKLEHKQ